MAFCSSCGAEVAPDVSFCPKCGKQLSAQTSEMSGGPTKRKSRWWYLVPIFLQIIGGIIAYLILKDDDRKLAKNCFWLGIILTIVPIVAGMALVIFGVISETDFTSFDSTLKLIE